MSESNGVAKTYIADGYTIRAAIHPIPNLHSGLRFEFRPMTPRQVSQYLTDSSNSNAKQHKEIQAKYVEKHVDQWDLCDGDGKGIEVTKDAFLDHMNPSLSVELFEIIAGFNPANEIASPSSGSYDSWFSMGDETKNS